MASATMPRDLALLVWLPGRGGPTDAAHDTGHDDDRHHVRDALQDLRCHVDAEDREQGLGRVGESEYERGKERTNRVPPPEDHRRQADEPLAGGHLQLE